MKDTPEPIAPAAESRDAPAIKTAKTWFSQVSGSTAQPIAIDWQRARVTGDWVVAPFVNQTNPFAKARKYGYRFALVQVPATGPCIGRLVELVIDGHPLTAEQAATMALTAVQPLVAAKAPVPLADLNGWVLVYSPTYDFQAGLVYARGVVQPQQVRLRTSPPPVPKTRKTPTANLMQQPTCLSVTTCGYVGPYLSNCVTQTYCVEGDDSGDGGGGGGSDESGGYGGSGGGGGSSAPTPVSAGTFRINPAYETLAPKLVQTLRDLRSFVLNNPKILNGLSKFSGQTQEKILYDLTYGQGPEIILGQPVDKYGNPVMGQFRSSTPNTLILDGAFINQLEHTDSATASQALSFYLAVAILHEYVHYGDYASGVSFPTEAGELFEQAVFGVVIGEGNAGEVMIEFVDKP